MTALSTQTAATSDDFKPVFVVGCGRSGTTLLAVLLDRHSQIAMTPETHFLNGFCRRCRDAENLGTQEKLVAALGREPRFKDMDLNPADVLEEFRDYPSDFKHLFRAMLEAYRQKNHKPRIGEKTPDHLEFVPQIIEWFPQARIICIVRDGRDVAQSNMKVHWTRKDLRLQGMVWRWAAKTCLEYVERYPQQFIHVRLEDLLQDPQGVMSRIDGFVGVAFEPQQLESRTETSVVLEHETEWMGKARQELDPRRIAAWTRQTNPHEKWLMNSMMGPYLRQFGYPDADMAGCPWWLRGWHQMCNFWCRLRCWGPAQRVLRVLPFTGKKS